MNNSQACFGRSGFQVKEFNIKAMITIVHIVNRIGQKKKKRKGVPQPNHESNPIVNCFTSRFGHDFKSTQKSIFMHFNDKQSINEHFRPKSIRKTCFIMN